MNQDTVLQISRLQHEAADNQRDDLLTAYADRISAIAVAIDDEAIFAAFDRASADIHRTVSVQAAAYNSLFADKLSTCPDGCSEVVCANITDTRIVKTARRICKRCLTYKSYFLQNSQLTTVDLDHMVSLIKQEDIDALIRDTKSSVKERIKGAFGRRSERLDMDKRLVMDKWHESPEWLGFRDEVIRSSGGMCAGCGGVGATNVECTNTYRRQALLLFDYVALCHDCRARMYENAPKRRKPGATIKEARAGLGYYDD